MNKHNLIHNITLLDSSQQKRFIKGLRQYGKNFFRIRKDFLPSKKTVIKLHLIFCVCRTISKASYGSWFLQFSFCVVLIISSSGWTDYFLLSLEENSRGCRNESLQTATPTAVLSQGKDPLSGGSCQHAIAKLFKWANDVPQKWDGVFVCRGILSHSWSCSYYVWHSLKREFCFAVDASSASEDDLDSEDSEQEIKSCSHCGATSE